MKTKVGKLDSSHPAYRDGYEYGGVCECGFSSVGWPLKKQATLRINAHLIEHETGELMPDRVEVEAMTPDKFEVAATGTVSPEDDMWRLIQ